MNVRFCPSCRSLILADFRYCPYCGAAVKGPELSEALDAPFSRMAKSSVVDQGQARAGACEGMPSANEGAPMPAVSARLNIFADVEESLVRLEADMELIIEELEKEGRQQG